MKHRELRSISFMDFSVESGDTKTTRGIRETPNCRLISGPQQRQSLPRELTTQAAPKLLLLSPDHYMEAHPHCIPTTTLEFSTSTGFCKSPSSPSKPSWVGVSATRGEDASSSFSPAPLQKLCLPPIHTSCQCSRWGLFSPSYLCMSSLIHLSLWKGGKLFLHLWVVTWKF